MIIVLEAMTWIAVMRLIPQVKSLDSKVGEHTHQLDSLNISIFDIERNTSAQLELEHKDIVSLAVSEIFFENYYENQLKVLKTLLVAFFCQQQTEQF